MRKGLSRWGYAGLALLLAHIVLLFLPPLPPLMKGSLWDWTSGYAAVAVLLVELGLQRRRVTAWWSRLIPVGRWSRGLAGIFMLLALAVSLRALAPELYVRFSHESGLWEPITLFCYLGAAVLLAGLSGKRLGPERKHWRFVTGLYVVLGLEEVDYFGIFGGVIGRIDGVYVGSLHDLILLAVDGLLGLGTWLVIAGVFLAVLMGLWWLGYLQPRALAALVFTTDFLWISMGLGFLLAGAVVEAQIFEWASLEPTFEESLEMAGGICFLVFGLQLAATRGRPHSDLSSPTT